MKVRKDVVGHKTVMVEKLVPVEWITLTLSMPEAVALLAVCGRIGGEPSGPRGVFSGHESSLTYALENAGVRDGGIVKEGSLILNSASWKREE